VAHDNLSLVIPFLPKHCIRVGRRGFRYCIHLACAGKGRRKRAHTTTPAVEAHVILYTRRQYCGGNRTRERLVGGIHFLSRVLSCTRILSLSRTRLRTQSPVLFLLLIYTLPPSHTHTHTHTHEHKFTNLLNQ
jgi:hypothetical protein